MTMTKEQALKVVNALPSEFEIDELIEKLKVMAAIDYGIKAVEEGKTKTHEEAKAIVKSWQK